MSIEYKIMFLISLAASLSIFCLLFNLWSNEKKTTARKRERSFHLSLVAMITMAGFSTGIEGGIMGWVENGLRYNFGVGLNVGFSAFTIASVYFSWVWHKRILAKVFS